MTHGLVIGKFLPYHAGHAFLIRSARERVDRLTVLVCSLQSEPIPGGLRYAWVRSAHRDCRVVWVNEEVPQAPEESAEFWPIWTDLIARHAGPVDVVFTSEDYGDELARRVGGRHESVDPARRTVPVSGSAILKDPLRCWEFLPAEVRPYFVRRVAIVGAESTGKTTIAERMAQEFGTVWVAEYGREYCGGRDARGLGLTDFEAIAWGQATWEDETAGTANRILLCDTELHTTCTWSDLIAGTRPAWLPAAARARRYSLVILLDSDVPWIDDGTRVLGPERAEHTRRLRREFETAGQPYVLVGGDYAARAAAAVRLIRERALRG